MLPGTIPYLLQATGTGRSFSDITGNSLLHLTSCTKPDTTDYIRPFNSNLSAAHHQWYYDKCLLYLLLYTLREVTKASAVAPKQIKPITTQHPKHLLRRLNLHLQTDRLFCAATSLMFFSLLWHSNFFQTGHNKCSSLLQRTDVAMYDMSHSAHISKTRAVALLPNLTVLSGFSPPRALPVPSGSDVCGNGHGTRTTGLVGFQYWIAC